MPAVPANVPTSLKLPGALKLQLEEDAKQMGMSLHAFMVSTLMPICLASSSSCSLKKMPNKWA